MKLNRFDWAAIILSVLISLAYWSGIAFVPFHPDESTQIFMSGDAEIFIQNPLRLAWTNVNGSDPRQVYRLLDAPMTRGLIGVGRAIIDLPPLDVDWNWSNTWSQNEAAGALPSPALLQMSRFSVDWLFPFSLIFTYLIGKKISGPRFGLLAMAALAANSLILLHTRRAMAESTLLFTTLSAVWVLMTVQKRVWLAAIPAALAIASKQTSLALVFAGLIWISILFIKNRKLLLKNLGIYLALVLVITFILNPFLWAQPVGATLASLNARQDLTTRQVSEFQQAIPGLVLATIPERTLGLVANLYFTPLQFNEVGNYIAQTEQAEAAYLGNPLHTLMRSLPGGMVLLFLSIIGIILAGLKIIKQGAKSQPALFILVLAILSVALTILLTIPLSFQRYIIPLVPLTTFLIVYPLDRLIGFAWEVGQRSRPTSR